MIPTMRRFDMITRSTELVLFDLFANDMWSGGNVYFMSDE
jgi:hypothetical protein